MSTGLTYITYGNVKLYRVVTHEIAQEPVFDESRTDLLYTKTIIRVSGFLHGHTDWNYQYQLPPGVGGDCATAHQAVRYQLPPRQPFQMMVGVNNDYTGGTALLTCNPAPFPLIPPPARNTNINLKQIDLTNGPRCTSFAVTHITGNELFAVDASFELAMLECDANGNVASNTYGVLSNRWTTEDSIDANMRTTRTYTGILVLASANLNAQMLRWVVAPPLQPLFRREHMHFVCTEDGLKIRWTITDVEIAVSAPFPARKWSVTHNVEMNGSNGAKMAFASVDVTLEGDSNVNKGDLIEIAVWVITEKLFGKKPTDLQNTDAKYIVDSISFTDHIGDVNIIQASARCHLVNDVSNGMVNAFSGFGFPFDKTMLPTPNDGLNGGIGNLAPYNTAPGFTPTNAAYDRSLSWGGYAGQVPAVEGPAQVIGIFACFLQNPCDDFHQIVKPTQTIPTRDTSQISNNPQVPYTATTTTELTQTQNPIYSTSQLTAAYKFWQIDNLYPRRMMRVQMPIASTNTNPYAPTSLVLTLCGAQQQWVIRCHAERVNAWPEFPDPEDLPAWPVPASPPSGYVPPTLTPLDYRLKPGTPVVTATGQLVYRATLQILVALSRPLTPFEVLSLGNDKWTNQGLLTTDPTLTGSSW